MINNTRIAPSPTGDFHLGTARTALLSYAAAKSSGGKFILRIDDTDAARNDDKSIDVIHDAMAWLGLVPDHTFRQSARYGAYCAARDHMLASGAAYRADDNTVRLRLPADLPDTWTDVVKGSPIRVSDHDRKLIDGLVLFRSDDTPTYHFASVVDDLDHDITLVLRGTDHLGNAIKHIAISMGLPGYRDIRYGHLGLLDIIGPDGKRKKMSKRDGGASLLAYRDAGYDRDAMIDFLFRGKGWSHRVHDFDKTTPMVSLDDVVRLFPDGNLKASPSLFDPKALAKTDRRFKASKGVVHYGKETI